MSGVIREGKMIGLRQGKHVLLLRSALGEPVAGCEKLISAIETGSAFNLEDVPDALREAVKQVVLPPDGICDSNGS